MFMYQYTFGNIQLKNKISISGPAGNTPAGKIPAEKSPAGKIPAGKNPSAPAVIIERVMEMVLSCVRVCVQRYFHSNTSYFKK